MIGLLDAATTGVGVYSISEAARYAKMHPNTLRNWFFPSGERSPMREGDIDPSEEKAISFLDFVEALAVRALRVDRKVPFKTIRQAISVAQKEYRVRYPFARRDHRTVLIGQDLHIFLQDDPESPVQISGKLVGQKSMTPCIEAYMADLSFDSQQMANLYTAFRFGEQQVIMNPRFHFGEPIVRENGVPADVLWQAAITEGGYDRAAKIYQVSVESVEAAYRFCNAELGLSTA